MLTAYGEINIEGKSPPWQCLSITHCSIYKVHWEALEHGNYNDEKSSAVIMNF